LTSNRKAKKILIFKKLNFSAPEAFLKQIVFIRLTNPCATL